MEAHLAGFFEEPEKRVKERVKNLGEFLCLVSVSDEYGWEELGVPILEEAFDRNVLWILKEAPHLGELTDEFVSQSRLKQSFRANRVSLRLLMFQVAFLKLAKLSTATITTRSGGEEERLAADAQAVAWPGRTDARGFRAPARRSGSSSAACRSWLWRTLGSSSSSWAQRL
jgi:hypothetical protein